MSHEEEELTPGERELEAALSALTPLRPAFSLQQALANAALARERRRTRIWQSIAAVLALAAGAAILLKPAPRQVEVEKIVYRTTPAPLDIRSAAAQPQGDAPLVVLVKGDFGYLHLRDKVLARGVDSLHATPELPAATQSPSIIGDEHRQRSMAAPPPGDVACLVTGGRS
jgi:hypothetical protein